MASIKQDSFQRTNKCSAAIISTKSLSIIFPIPQSQIAADKGFILLTPPFPKVKKSLWISLKKTLNFLQMSPLS